MKGHYQTTSAEKAKKRKNSRGLYIGISKSNTVILYGRKKND